MSETTTATILVPGQPVLSAVNAKGPALKYGAGTYERDGVVRASLVGSLENKSGTISLPRARPNPPSEQSVILGTITRLTPLQATVAISVVDGLALPAGEEFQGIIRVQDVRATEKDKVKIGESFRGGDVVRGVVISLGDARSYYITTARNDLGVIFATSEAGATMQPVSWLEMRCPKTGLLERRKCAKPDGL